MKKIIIVFVCLIASKYIYSQNRSDIYTPPTPEASSLIKIVDVPTNYSTGGVTYSIPIHNITLKDLIIPISLSYQSSGFKPSEIASNVGLGWDVNVGGKIIQNVIGKNDIDVPGPGNNFWNLPNDRDFKLPKSVPLLNANPYPLDSLHSSSTDYYMISQLNTYIDVQPDIFYYSTPVKSGKFFFASNFETKKIPFGKEKIVYNTNNHNFEIVDTNGVRYLYEVRTENYNTTINQCGTIPELNGTSNSNSYTYYLSKIITPKKEIVEFIYDTVKYDLLNDKDYTRYYQSFNGGTEKTTLFYSQITSKILVKIKVNQKDEVEFLYNKYRKDIKGTQQQFAPKTLDAIKVKYDNDISLYEFDYGYFEINESAYNSNVFESSITNEDSNYRLKLKSFKKVGENPYVFSYLNESNVQRHTQCLDHWGYFSTYSCNRYTFNSLFGDSFGASKASSFLDTQSNILKDITLPTKGIIEFTYELNDCNNCEISNQQFYWDDVVTLYSNTDDIFSNEWQTVEQYFTMPDHNISLAEVKFNLHSEGSVTTENNAQVFLYDDQNNLIGFQTIGIGNQQSPLIGIDPQTGFQYSLQLQSGKTYRLVLECKDNMENENKYIGFVVLRPYNNPIVNSSIGGLRVQNIKMKEGNNLKYHKSYEYKINNQSSGKLYEKPSYFDEYNRSFVYGTDNEFNEWNFSSYLVQYSRIPSDLFGFDGHHIYYEKVTEKKHDVQNISNFIKTEKCFTFYDDLRYGDNTYFQKISYNWKRGLISQINEFKNNDTIRKTTYSYKFLDTPAGIVNNSSIESGNHIDNPTFPNEFHQRSLSINLLKANLNFYNIYDYKSSKLISSWYYMDKKTTEENFDGNILKTEETYKYENLMNAQLTSVLSNNSLGETSETKYYYAHDLANQALINKNMVGIPLKTETKHNGIVTSTQETTYKDWDPSSSELLAPEFIKSSKASNTLETKIKFNNYDTHGNALEVQQENGMLISYIYAYNNTLLVAKLENIAYASIPPILITAIQNATDTGTYSEANLKTALDNLRNHASLSNAMVSTYIHKPLIGISSATDPKGDTQTYHYDSFNRLQFVKDKNGNILSENQYNYRP